MGSDTRRHLRGSWLLIAVDTNILVYVHREESPWHERAFERIRELAEARAPWAIPWPCLHEFLGIVTHPRVYAPPSSPAAAVEQVEEWLRSPSLALLAEDERFWPALRDRLLAGRAVGPRVHDARIAALCLHHGVAELWSADRDFGRFPELSVRNPLIE